MEKSGKQTLRVICEGCKKPRVSVLQGRNICDSCYSKESTSHCKRCNQKRREIDEMGLCSTCLRKDSLPSGICSRCQKDSKIVNSTKKLCQACQNLTLRKERLADKPKAECSVCKKIRPSVLLKQVICGQCYRTKIAQRKYGDYYFPCAKCGRKRRNRHGMTELCIVCEKIEARPKGVCSACSCETKIFNQDDWLCQKCHVYKYQQKKNKIKQNKSICSQCGELRASALIRRSLCQTCWAKEKNGQRVCKGCNKEKVIINKTHELCKQCYGDSVAPRSLRRYIDEYISTFPENERLFHLFANSIDWSSVAESDNRQVQLFGRFLQEHHLEQPITWKIIEEALPELDVGSRDNAKKVRGCLFRLGNLLAARGELELWDSYLKRRCAERQISKAPQSIQPHLYEYFKWMLEHKYSIRAIGGHLSVLANFWSWGERFGTYLPETVQPSIITNYFISLRKQWQCLACQKTIPFDPYNRKPPSSCFNCNTLQSLQEVEHLSQATVVSYRPPLIVFFDWCKKNRLVLFNPVGLKVDRPRQVLQHYPLGDIQKLCNCIKDPEADPIEALVLYLIIFHAFTTQELRFAQIPAIYSLDGKLQESNLAEAYYLKLPKHHPTRGRLSSNRPSEIIDFPPGAEFFLKPLLTRFEAQRQQLLAKPDKNSYLLVAPTKARHNKPVSQKYVQRIVRQASLPILGETRYPKLLRITAGIILNDSGALGILTQMGWEAQQAFAYDYIPRVEVHPKGDRVR